MLLASKAEEKFACDGCKHNSHNWEKECYECVRRFYYIFFKYKDKWAPEEKFLADNEEGGTKDENQSH